jgi:hypothetical protein
MSRIRARLVPGGAGSAGFAGGNLTMYSIWLPEQYRTECRASAFGFATSVGRFAAAGITFLGTVTK